MERFIEEKENRAGSAGRTVVEERVRVAGTGFSSGTGRSGERNAREVGLSDNLGEDRVQEDHQELVVIERHW